MRVLNFTFRGESYRVNKKGYINTDAFHGFSDTWIFGGGIKHHWGTKVSVTLADAFENPERLNGCLGSDIDHGTMRIWGGRYNGKLPRIENCYVENNP